MKLLPVATGLAALLLGLVLTPYVRRKATELGAVHLPREDRWNRRSVAMFGGVAIAATVVAAALPLARSFDWLDWALLVSSVAMFVVGFVDDRISLKPHTKLLAQIVMAALMAAAGLQIGLPGPIGEAIDPFVTVLWVVGLTNAFNLLDNIDGLCAGTAAIAAFFLAIIGTANGSLTTAAMVAAMLGACLGYLRYNRFPATIFMGDCGSLFIGHFLACAALIIPGAGVRSTGLVLVAPALVMLLPLLDTGLVTLSRKWFRRPVSQGGRDHTSHRLVSIGLSEPKAVLVLHSVSLMGGAAALGMLYGVPWLSRPLAVIAFLVAAMLAWYLLRIRTYPPGSSLTDSLNRTTLPMLGQHKYRRRIGEVIFDAIAIGLGLWLAYNLRFESEAALPHRSTALFAAMPVVVACHLVAYFVCGVYRGIWRYTSAVDVPRFVGAVVLGGLLARLALGMLDLYHFGSSSLLAINGLVQFGLLGGSRGFFRLMHEMFRGASAEARNTLLVGTGELAEVWLRRLLFDPDRAVRPVGLVTALPEQVGLRVHGLPVVGTRESLAGMLSTLHVEEVLRIDPTYSEEDWQAIVALCDAHGVRTRELHVEL